MTKIIAFDIYDRPICEYDDMENEVFCDTKLENLLFEEPKKIIIVDGKRYKCLD
jgi:hypothetical protein